MQLGSPPTLGSGPHQGKWALPKKKITVVRNEPATEHKPSYLSTKIKSTPVHAAARPSRPYAGVKLKPAASSELKKSPVKKEKRTVEKKKPTEAKTRRASFADISLKPTGNAQVLKSGGDVGNKTLKLGSEPLLISESPLPVLLKKPFPPTDSGASTPQITNRRHSYAGIELKKSPRPTAKPTIKNPRRASFAEIELKQSAHGDVVKSGGDPIVSHPERKDHSLPEEFSKVELKDAATPVQPEVEILEEEIPDYTAVPLKDASTPVKPEVEVLVEAAPEYTAVHLKTAEVVEKPKVQARRASYADLQLNKSSYGEAIKGGGDVVKVSCKNHATPEPSYKAVHLKASGRGDVIKSGGDVLKGHGQRSEPSYSAVQLKKSSHGEAIKSGGDVVKDDAMDSSSRHALPSEFEEVHLKKADSSIQPEVEVLEEEKPDYSAVELKRSSHGEAIKTGGDLAKEVAEDPKKHALPEEFASVELKKSDTPIQPEVEVVSQSNLDYSAIPLKATKFVEKPRVQARRASYADVPLKRSGHGDAIKCGGDVVKEVTESTGPLYANAQLKSTGHGESLRTGGDVVKAQADGQRKHDLPDDFASVHLKKADIPVQPEIEPLVEQVLDYSAIQLKKTDIPVQPEIEPLPEQVPDYTAIQLKPVEPSELATVKPRKSSYGSGKIFKCGGGVVKEGKSDGSEHALPEEFAVVQLKKPAPVVPEVEVPADEVPDYSAVPLKAAQPVERPVVAKRASYADLALKKSGHGDEIKSGGDVQKQPEDKQKEPSYASVALNSTGHGTALKNGGDVVKECLEEPNAHVLPAEFSAVQLKAADTTIEPEIEPIVEDAPDYMAVQLKAADIPLQPEIELLAEEAPEYIAVQLKALGPVEKKAAKPRRASYAELVPLKATEPLIKPAVRSRRASYADLELRKSGYGDAIKIGGDVVKDPAQSQEEFHIPAFACRQLKSTGHGNAVKVGGHADSSKTTEVSAPSFSGVKLKSTGHGNSVKRRKDVPPKIKHSKGYDNKHVLRKNGDHNKHVQRKKAPAPTENSKVTPRFFGVQLKSSADESKAKLPRRCSYGGVQLRATGKLVD